MQELTTLFDTADVVEFSHKDGKSYAHLYKDNNAKLADITGRKDLIHNRCEIYERRFTNRSWKDVCFEGYKRNTNLVIIDDSLANYYSSLESDNKNEILQPVKFKRRKYHLEEGLSGQLLSLALWPLFKDLPGDMPARYWYGDGYFKLQHKDETLKFKVFANNDDGLINHRNLSIFKLPTDNADAIKLLKISHFDNQHLESGITLNKQYSKDVGLYLVRKKGVNPEAIIQSRKAKWKVTFSGLPSSKPITGYITFAGPNYSEKLFIAGVKEMSPAYELPQTISMEWFSHYKKQPFQLQINDSSTVTFQQDNKETQVGLSIFFDQAELTETFNKLSEKSASKKKDTVIEIEVQLNKLDKNKAQLKVVLLANQQQIELKQHHYSFRNVKEKGQSSTSTNKLKVLYDECINNGSLDAVLLHIDELAKRPDYIEKKAAYVVYILTLLVNHYNTQGDFARSKQVALYYAKNLQHPLSLLDDASTAKTNHYIVISQSLAVALRTGDLVLQKGVLKMLGENFDINTTKNPTLVYNLACYYAINNKKEAMLVAVKKSRNMGKTAKQFLADTDFKEYYDDEDFLTALNVSN